MVVKILRKNEMAVAEHMKWERDQPRSPRKTNRKEWAAEEELPTNTQKEGALGEMGETKRRQGQESWGKRMCQGEEQCGQQRQMWLTGQAGWGQRCPLRMWFWDVHHKHFCDSWVSLCMCVCVCAHVSTEMITWQARAWEQCARTGWRPPQGGLWSAHRKPSFTLGALGKEY